MGLDAEAAAVCTVDDLYRLICSKLGVARSHRPSHPPGYPAITEKEKIFLFLQRHHPLPAPLLPWSSQTVWAALVAIFVANSASTRRKSSRAPASLPPSASTELDHPGFTEPPLRKDFAQY